MSKKPKQAEELALPLAGTAVGVVSPGGIQVQQITDPGVLQQGRVFAEALRQTEPLAASGTREAAQAAAAVKDGTALPAGIRAETSARLVTAGRPLNSTVAGANPIGKAAEIVSISDYRELHAGRDPGIVNSPEHVANNVDDIRLSPHHASRKDLVFRFRTHYGMLITKFNGQVKTGSAQYISDKLVEMAETPGYGKVGYVDGRFVNPDGTPRVSSDAFSQAQAERLQRAKVRLRGIPDLDARAEKLISDINRHTGDHLDPLSREQLRLLRDDIAQAYRPKGVAVRAFSGAAVAAATAAIVTLVVQYASEGKIDVASVGTAAGKAAAYGAGAAVIDAGIYHAAPLAGMAPEAAKVLAQQSVAVGFCALAIGADVFAEVKMARAGDVSKASAVAGVAAKSALDALPLVLAPLGLLGIPVLVGAQLGGRWAIAKVRDAELKLGAAIEEDFFHAATLAFRLDRTHDVIAKVKSDCDEADRLFADAMQGSSGSCPGLI
jgi:hypothetical protein